MPSTIAVSSTTMSSSIGIQGSTMLPPTINKSAHSTPSSMSSVTSSEPTPATTSSCLGKYTFLMRLPFEISDSVVCSIESDRNLYGSNPQSRKKTKLFKPLGSPTGGCTLRNCENTIQ